MGWITLSCRSKEDLSCKANYQFRLLQVSREQRQKAREYQFMQTETQNNQKSELRNIRSSYEATIETNREALNMARRVLSIVEKQEANANGTGSYTITQEEQDLLDLAQQTIPALANANSTQIETEISNLEQALEQAQEDREYEINEATSLWEDELEMIEAEANDVEVMYQQEQTEIETQLEHVSNELQSVKDSTSTEIQNGTIRLS